MSEIVLDSSAILAMIFVEPGGEKVRSALLAQSGMISVSTVNFCEVMNRLRREMTSVTAQMVTALLPGVEFVPFDLDAAAATALFYRTSSPLSLGDRACLALAQRRGANAWTTDKIWAQMDHGVPVEILR